MICYKVYNFTDDLCLHSYLYLFWKICLYIWFVLFTFELVTCIQKLICLVDAVSKGYAIHAQNRRKVFELIAKHIGGPVVISSNEFAELVARFNERPKYTPEGTFCELGDQAADPKVHSGSAYCVRDIRVLRANVVTGGTMKDLRWLLNSFVINIHTILSAALLLSAVMNVPNNANNFVT